jgi:hypothetical protein
VRRTPHDPTRLSTYQRVHETRLEQLRATGAIAADTLEWSDAPGRVLWLRGEIAFRGNIVVNVEKKLELRSNDSDPLVQTVMYAYNASVRGCGTFLRFDNTHPYPGHPDDHHRHDGDWRRSDEDGEVSWVGEQGWPTLGTFLEYVERWYWENRGELPEPDAFPELGLR